LHSLRKERHICNPLVVDKVRTVRLGIVLLRRIRKAIRSHRHNRSRAKSNQERSLRILRLGMPCPGGIRKAIRSHRHIRNLGHHKRERSNQLRLQPNMQKD
jgi:hypothetical protein